MIRMINDHEQFEVGLISKGLIPIVDDHQVSGFRAILKLLHLPRGCRALDVGAGGFLGTTTTVHLIDVLAAEVTALEINPERASKLAAKFGDRLTVVASSFEQYIVQLSGENKYNLVVFDIDTPLIPKIFDTMIDAASAVLTSDGFIISVFIYDIDGTFNCEPPLLSRLGKALQEEFLIGKFGTTKVDAFCCPARVHRQQFHGSWYC
jgi:cyclopropane fatty-acyl-phospholipid synthase-like methyltransferase